MLLPAHNRRKLFPLYAKSHCEAISFITSTVCKATQTGKSPYIAAKVTTALICNTTESFQATGRKVFQLSKNAVFDAISDGHLVFLLLVGCRLRSTQGEFTQAEFLLIPFVQQSFRLC